MLISLFSVTLYRRLFVSLSYMYKFISLMYIIAKIYDRMQWNVTNLCRWTPFSRLKCAIMQIYFNWSVTFLHDAKNKIICDMASMCRIYFTLWIGCNKMWINQSLKEMIKEVSDARSVREILLRKMFSMKTKILEIC